MPKVERNLAAELRELAAEVSQADAARLQERVLARKGAHDKGRKRLFFATFGLAGAGAVLSAAALSGFLGADSPPNVIAKSHADESVIAGVQLPIPPGRPCLGARRLQPSYMASHASKRVNIWMPHSRWASPSSLQSSWNCGDRKLMTPTLVFPNMTIDYDPYPVADPQQWFAGLAGQWGGSVITIKGLPAYVEAGEGTYKAELMIQVDQVMIKILADPDTPVPHLIDAIESMDFAQPVGS